jgi:heptosyltransferase-3
MDRLAADTNAAFIVTSGPEARETQIARATAAASTRARADLHTGDLTLRHLAALIQEAHLFLGVDTAPMHIAAAVGTRVVAVFGPSDDQMWGPWGEGHIVVRRTCHCLAQRRCGCDEATGMQCLNALKGDDVHQAAMKILTENAVARAYR